MYNYKTKFCLRCDCDYVPLSGNQLYCYLCREIVKHEYSIQYLIKNPRQKVSKKIIQCCMCGKSIQRNSGYQKYCVKCSIIVDKEKEKVRMARWYQKHKQRCSDNCKKYYRNHVVEISDWNKFWRQSPQGKESGKKHTAKRKLFGFCSINEYFVGSEGHHIDMNYVIYIPKKLHNSVWHNALTGFGMNDINELAFRWLDQQSLFI